MSAMFQAMQCLLSEEVVADVPRTQTQIGANVQKSANDLIDAWVQKASSEDVHDLGRFAGDCAFARPPPAY